MASEMKGLAAGTVAAIVAVGGAFALGAIMRSVDSSSPPAPVAGSARTGAPSGASASQEESQDQAGSTQAGNTGTGANTGAAGTGGAGATGATAGTGAATASKLFAQNCASCHGNNAQGSMGPNLHHLKMTDMTITTIIQKGKGSMPPFGGSLSAAQVQSLVTFIRSLK